MKKYLSIALLIAALSPLSAFSEENPEFVISIKDHKFNPSDITIPADKKVKLIVKNEDSTPEEFESYDLNREKIINGKSQAVIFVGPLKPGEYKYFGEFNQDTAQGKIIVK